MQSFYYKNEIDSVYYCKQAQKAFVGTFKFKQN